MLTVDLCVIGAGSGGLTVAAGASQMGAAVALVERDRMGGDCLNFGCVPSKALLAAAKAAQAMRDADRLGIERHEPRIDYAEVMAGVHEVIAEIAPQDSRERFEGLGVKVLRGEARFVDRAVVEVGGETIRARRFVIATGSAPLIPKIPGLDTAPYLTNETLFENTQRPSHLIVIGGGPIGVEMAQAHRRLGSAVTIVEQAVLLPKDDPELVDVVRARLLAEGVTILEGAALKKLDKTPGGVAASIEHRGKPLVVTGSHLLLAVGRKPNIEALNLAAAGVTAGPRGIETDQRLKTSNRKIYAIGDVNGRFPFTHAAGYHAGIVLRNALFRLPAKVDDRAMPWVTYTDPELAQVGLTEAAARDRHGQVSALRWPFHDNDRAQAERRTDGFAKVVLDRGGRILGASIVGAHAGELAQPWVMAISRGLKIGAMAGMVAPYPTLGEISKRVAGSYFTPKLFNDRTRRIVRFLLRLG